MVLMGIQGRESPPWIKYFLSAGTTPVEMPLLQGQMMLRVASMTCGQTGRSPSIPKRVSYLEHPAWTSPSVVACCLLDTMITLSTSGMFSKGPGSPSCLAMKTALALYEFPPMGLLSAQDHGIIPSESGPNHLTMHSCIPENLKSSHVNRYYF
uniref:Macaca fascicularis brain cDNA clone: QflA-19509, similar to human guanine nucleotide binding protein (G protein), beta 5(GNB5), transcript variant 2, mRNA, RefSeq: NM_016194.2 n=1 Tax=Macaca fascicularis TaxID=9541 RepID=I7GIF8_MACFA|nr:unnamed protein product [Macaca fascicularis]